MCAAFIISPGMFELGPSHGLRAYFLLDGSMLFRLMNPDKHGIDLLFATEKLTEVDRAGNLAARLYCRRLR